VVCNLFPQVGVVRKGIGSASPFGHVDERFSGSSRYYADVRHSCFVLPELNVDDGGLVVVMFYLVYSHRFAETVDSLGLRKLGIP